jgi:hypothetical protein
MKNRTLLRKTRVLFLFTLLCAAIASLQSVHAVTITVMNTNDSGASSLRQALADANDGDTINFGAPVTGTITLTSGELLVNDSITISGPGANVLAVNGNAASRVFHIASGKTVTISSFTVTNGSAPHLNGGGGIYNDHATLTVNNCTISGNSAFNGGGIDNDSTGGFGSVIVNDSTFIGNSATFGGGMDNDTDGGALVVNNSTLSANGATVGGGIYSNNGVVGILNSTLSGNAGVGIYNAGSSNLIIGSTILNSGENIRSDSGMVFSDGYNLSSDEWRRLFDGHWRPDKHRSNAWSAGILRRTDADTHSARRQPGD